MVTSQWADLRELSWLSKYYRHSSDLSVTISSSVRLSTTEHSSSSSSTSGLCLSSRTTIVECRCCVVLVWCGVVWCGVHRTTARTELSWEVSPAVFVYLPPSPPPSPSQVNQVTNTDRKKDRKKERKKERPVTWRQYFSLFSTVARVYDCKKDIFLLIKHWFNITLKAGIQRRK